MKLESAKPLCFNNKYARGWVQADLGLQKLHENPYQNKTIPIKMFD